MKGKPVSLKNGCERTDKECQNKTGKTYGYRRVWKWLNNRNIDRKSKTVLRIMRKYGLLSEIRRDRKWVNLGQQIQKYQNLLKRQFRADRPNLKWVTDISYIHTKEGVPYLSMIRDLYDNSIVTYTDHYGNLQEMRIEGSDFAKYGSGGAYVQNLYKALMKFSASADGFF